MKIFTDLNKKTIIISESQLSNLITEAMSLTDIYTKYYSNIPKDIFNQIIQSDPTYNIQKSDKMGKFGKWLLQIYNNGNLKIEDLYKVKQYLETFVKFYNKIENKDIMRYKNLPELYNNIKPFLDNTVQSTSKSDEIRKIKENGSERFYEDSKWLVIIPKTKEAACYYGKGTQWCTAATESHNMFDTYNSEGKLYININKQTGEKYQFHFESEQFMDAEDDSIMQPIAYEIGLTNNLVNAYIKLYGINAALKLNTVYDKDEIEEICDNYYIINTEENFIVYFNGFDFDSIVQFESNYFIEANNIYDTLLPLFDNNKGVYCDLVDYTNGDIVTEYLDSEEIFLNQRSKQYIPIKTYYDGLILFDMENLEEVEDLKNINDDIFSISSIGNYTYGYKDLEYFLIKNYDNLNAIYDAKNRRFITNFIYDTCKFIYVGEKTDKNGKHYEGYIFSLIGQNRNDVLLNNGKLITKEEYDNNINESKKNFIREGLSKNDRKRFYEELDNLQTQEEQYKFCLQHLGKPFANGSSRKCFTISDKEVLKLAYNDKGEAQNKVEYTIFSQANSFVLPKINKVSKNYRWLTCEHVLPCEYEDFEQIFKKPFDRKWRQNSADQRYPNGKWKTIGFDKYFDNLKEPSEKYDGMDDILSILWYIDDVYGMGSEENYDVRDSMYYERLISGNKWFIEIKRLCKEFHLTDLTQIENYGLVKRNGKMMIVILDYGMDYNTFNDYYT